MSDRSRLVVLSLPSSLTRDGLRDHFASLNLSITDVKLLSNKAGISRRVGFIGFENNADAQQAKDWFDGTWLAGSRIKVEFAETDVLPTHDKKHLGQASLVGHGGGEESSLGQDSPRSTLPMVDTPHLKRDTPADDESDASYLNKRMKRQPGGSMYEMGQVADDKSESRATSPLSSSSPGVHDPSASGCASSTGIGRLFLRNLSFSITKQNLLDTFSSFGEIAEIHVPCHEGHNKGIAFIQFVDPNHAMAARQAMDGKALSGRLLHIIPASARLHSPSAKISTHEGRDVETFLQRKKAKLSAQADQSFNWASLYMGSDAVVTSLASRYGSSKADLLDATDSSAASRLALAESYIIQETKDYFATSDINIEAFDKPGPRSLTTLLLKNLPAGTTLATVKSLLGSENAINRVRVPPSGAIAVVELCTSSAAAKAAKSLAYRKLGNSLIYVERAPSHIWKENITPEDGHAKSAHGLREDSKDTGVSSGKPALSSSLYVTGLPSHCSTATFRSVFQSLPGFTYATINSQPSGRDRGHAKLSGFVGFTSWEHAQQAMKVMNGHVLEGHVLSIVPTRSSSLEHLPTAKSSSAKLLVKNLPFEIKKQQLTDLLSAYGKVQSLRMPVNAQARSRGFAFVQFETPQEANAARQGLSHGHILGRHMIVEEAQ